MNSAKIVGRLGKDPFFKIGQYGAFMRFDVATDESYRDPRSNQWVEATEWHEVFVKGDKLARTLNAQQLKKGDLVVVEGSYRTKTSNSNGEPTKEKEIRAKSVLISMPIPKLNQQSSNEARQNNGQQTSNGGRQNSYGGRGNGDQQPTQNYGQQGRQNAEPDYYDNSPGNDDCPF